MRALPTKSLLLASALLALPQLAAAQGSDALADALKARPDEAKSYEDYATAALKASRFDDAIAQLKVGVARVPDFARGWYLLGYAYRKQSAWSDAAGAYRVYTFLRPNETDAWFGLGKALQGLGDGKGAASALKKYVSLESRPQAQKFVDEAKADLAKLEGGGGDPAKLRADADRLKAEQKWEEAATAYRRALEMDGNNRDLHNDLGLCLFQQGKFDDASTAFKDATARDASFDIAWYNLARALRKASRNAEAVDAYRKYMALKPGDPDPYFGLGQTLKALGDTRAATAAFEKYIELEKRPEQAKWIDKARSELATLRPASSPTAIDEK